MRVFTKTALLALAGLAALVGSAPAQAQATVDGTRDASYPAALAVQTVQTQFGDKTVASSQTASGGSELDNIHAQIVGSNLYLFIGGNLSDNFNKLDLFFDSKAGGQNTLTGNGYYVGAMNGLTFDTGFTADFALTVGGGVGNTMSYEVYTNYVPLPTSGITTSTDFTGGGAGRTQTINFNLVTAGAGTGTVSIDNSNILGVTGGTAAANTADATAVSTGIEYVIPLSALGTTMGGGNIRIAAFVNSGDWQYQSNQVLAGLPAGSGNLGYNGSGGGNPNNGTPNSVNFNSFAGNQYVTVANAAATSQISVSPTMLTFGNVGTSTTATRTFDIDNVGGGTLNVTSITSSNAAFTVSPNTATITSTGANVTVTVTFAPTANGLQSGSITLASNDPANPSVVVSVSGTGTTQQAIIGATPASQSFNSVGVGSSATRTVNITNTGTGPLTVTGITSSNSQFSVSPTTATVPVGGNTNVTVTFAPTTAGAQTSTLTIASNDPATPNKTVTVSGNAVAAGQIIVDGTLDAGLYTQKALQTAGTQFGNNQSELDGAFVRVTTTDLYVTLTGNLETGGNKLVVFFDADPATGQNQVANNNPTVDFGSSGNLAGLRFDRGFAPESFISFNHSGGQLYANFARLDGSGGSGSYVSTNGNGFIQPLGFRWRRGGRAGGSITPTRAA